MLRHSLNFAPDEASNYCTIEGESETLPNQSMSVDEILERFSRGESHRSKDGQFEVGDDLDDTIALEVYDKPDNPDPLTEGLEIMEELEERRKYAKKKQVSSVEDPLPGRAGEGEG